MAINLEERSNFRWFLAGPLAIPERLAPQSILEKYDYLLDGQSSFHWRGVIKPEIEKRGMEAVDPYSSDVAEYCAAYGMRDGYLEVLRQCDGVVSVLMPYHWESIPERETNLSVALRYWKYPMVAYSPIVNLTAHEKKTTTEIKRFVMLIPACLRIAKAVSAAAMKGIHLTENMYTKSETLSTRKIKCECGCVYVQTTVSRVQEEEPCPKCGKSLLEE